MNANEIIKNLDIDKIRHLKITNIFTKEQAEVFSYGVLNRHNINKVIQINLNSVYCTTMYLTEHHEHMTINLPKMLSKKKNTNKYLRSLYGRYGFLMHELAHIIYTDFSEFEKLGIIMYDAFNITEDARVEHLISQNDPDLKLLFRELRASSLTNKNKRIVENHLNFDNLCYFIIFTYYDFEFNKTDNTIFYKDIYKQHSKDLFTESTQLFIKTMKEIYNKFNDFQNILH